MLYAYIFVSTTLIGMAGILLTNVLAFPRLRPTAQVKDAPLVSVLVPARNEAAVIATTLRGILAQTYTNIEVVMLDDHSQDDTFAIAQSIAAQDPRLRVLRGVTLPVGWLGKAWACQQLGQAARGDVLVFADADTVWHPEALNAVINAMQTTRADLYTVWPTQQTHTWAERLVVPLMTFVILSYLPVLLVHHTPFAVFAAANGQFMAWRKAAYLRVGGHQRVANNVLDDVTLARCAKKRGLRLRMADGSGLLGCRMYTNWTSTRDGFAKNILAGYGNSVIALVVAAVFHWVVFLLPFVGLLVDGWRVWSLTLLVLAMCLRALSAAFARQRVLDALLMPVSVLLMTRIAAQAVYWHFNGGARWKGRVITTHAKELA